MIRRATWAQLQLPVPSAAEAVCFDALLGPQRVPDSPPAFIQTSEQMSEGSQVALGAEGAGDQTRARLRECFKQTRIATGLRLFSPILKSCWGIFKRRALFF